MDNAHPQGWPCNPDQSGIPRLFPPPGHRRLLHYVTYHNRLDHSLRRSLRRCATLCQIAELKFLLRLTLNVGTILCSRTVCLSNKGLYLR
jgi:hypothetical protein